MPPPCAPPIASIVAVCTKYLGYTKAGLDPCEDIISFDGDSWQLSFVLKSSVSFFALNLAIVELIAKPLAWRALGSGVKQAKVDKFAQSFTEILQYGSFFIVGALILADQTWAWVSAVRTICLSTASTSPHPTRT